MIDPCNRSTNAKLYFNRATVAAKQKKTNECISDCDKAIELDPSYVKPLLRRAKCYMESEQYEEAVRDYENLLKSNKGNMEYRYLDNSLLMKFPFSKLKFTFLVRIELYNGNGPYLRNKMLFYFI